MFQIAGVPPHNGSTIFVNMGCTEKSSAAFRKMATANTGTRIPVVAGPGTSPVAGCAAPETLFISDMRIDGRRPRVVARLGR